MVAAVVHTRGGFIHQYIAVAIEEAVLNGKISGDCKALARVRAMASTRQRIFCWISAGAIW